MVPVPSPVSPTKHGPRSLHGQIRCSELSTVILSIFVASAKGVLMLAVKELADKFDSDIPVPKYPRSKLGPKFINTYNLEFVPLKNGMGTDPVELL